MQTVTDSISDKKKSVLSGGISLLGKTLLVTKGPYTEGHKSSPFDCIFTVILLQEDEKSLIRDKLYYNELTQNSMKLSQVLREKKKSFVGQCTSEDC